MAKHTTGAFIRSLKNNHLTTAQGTEESPWLFQEQKPAKEGTVEAWGRSEKNPVGGWYG